MPRRARPLPTGEYRDSDPALVATDLLDVTDAKTVGDAGQGVPIPAAQNIITSYPMALVKGTTNAGLGSAWIDYVAGPEGQKVLRAAGFLPPS